MFRAIAKRPGALGLLLAGVVVGGVGAQVTQDFHRSGYLTGALFTLLDDEVARFHVSLDDHSAGPVGRVQMRLIDDEGNVVARQVVSLGPGQSATLEHRGAGRYRAQAETFESALSLSDRRIVVAGVELFDVDDFTIRPTCGLIPPPKL